MAERVRFKIPGRESPDLKPRQDAEVADFLNATVRNEIQVSIAARGVPVTVQTLDRSADSDSDVVELEFEGGIRQYINPAQLRDDLKKRKANLVARGGDASGDVVEIPTDFGHAQSRGIGDLVLKTLRIVGIDLAGAAARQAVRLVISQFEGKLDPPPGLYQLRDPRNVEKEIRATKDIDARGPCLLLLHGTASSISGSFGGLVTGDTESGGSRTAADDWAALSKHYDGRMFALQHRSLSESPVRNALDVARLLPDSARLHLVSHSRGGLVGELLCLTDLRPWHFNAFERAAVEELVGMDDAVQKEVRANRAEEVQNIKDLAEVLRTKHLQVERFVRVASPARGTILASRRLDVYLTVLLNVLGLIPALHASTLYSFIKATLLETARRRTDPRELPGLEAMMPESPLIALLNQESFRSTADLAVIAGDLEPEGIWSKLSNLAIDLFYREDNDLVVNTRAMYGGMQRVRNASYFFNKGPHVNHFHYFRNPGTRSRLRDWLLAPQGGKVEGFQEFVAQQKEFHADTRRAAEDDRRPILILLPDMLASELSDVAGPVWLSSSAIAKGGLIRLLEKDLKPTGLLPAYYADLCNELSSDYRVERLAYDWRESLLSTVSLLKPHLKQCLDRGKRVAILGHGAGGTLGLLLARDEELWSRFIKQGGRLVMLGSPVIASGFAMGLLNADARLNRLLRLVDRQSNRAPEELFGEFEGVRELAGLNGEALRKALHFEKPPVNVVYVAGAAAQTILPGGTSGAGDGHVTWDQPRFLNLPAWQMGVPHGNLASHMPAVPAILELLSRGTTERLPSLAVTPVTQDGVLTADEPLLYPTESDLADAAVGGVTGMVLKTAEPPLRAWVSHGHLRHARYPVMVGHYNEDSMVSAEKVLDRALGGRLSARFAAGVYPGREATAEIILAPAMHPPGALVIGLGEVGELTQEKIRRSVTAALLRCVLAISESGALSASAPGEIGISALVIGAYGELDIQDSVVAIIRGVLEANRQLRLQTANHSLRVTAVEFIDIYEDVAIQASHELLNIAERLNGDSSSGQLLSVDAFMHVVEGGQTSRPLDPHQTGWWRRVRISANKTGNLGYSVVTDRARSDDSVQGTQRRLVDAFIAKAVNTTKYDKELSAALFQLLVPRSMRDVASDNVNVVLLVDRNSAAYPWELLAYPTRTGVEPLATSCGMLRQFRSPNNKLRPAPASGVAALVVGDTQSGLPPLPEAREEAKAVAKRLQAGGYNVNPLPPDVDPLHLVSELVVRQYRIMHLAAHGSYVPGDASRSGIVIGKDLLLTPMELSNLPAAPDLVFVNCCHLGGIDTTETRPGPVLAASFAETLMDLGIKAVIVAGWAVDDVAGRTFADRFYERMLDAERPARFGEAVLEARDHTRKLHPDRNTWGAYQCYGNPDFRLKMLKEDKSGLGENQRWYVARTEILQRLQDLAAAAQESPAKDVREQLEKLREMTPVGWRDGEVFGAYGKAYAAFGDRESAIVCYQQALVDETSCARLKVVQDLANLLERGARTIQGEQRDDDLKRAIDLLRGLEGIAATGELASLLGAYYKRQGQYSADPQARMEAYHQALKHYEEAYRKRKEIHHDEVYYPGVNAVSLALVVGDADVEKWMSILAHSITAAKEKSLHSQDFWSRATLADALLVRCLWDKSLFVRQNDVLAGYQDVINGGGRPFELGSMVDQLRFLAEALRGTENGPALAHLLNQIGSR
jgi:tetratricopeptide (TPR) repeat protein